MSTPLIVVSGTGTEIGKTHVTRALIAALARALRRHGVAEPRVAGLKPVETGVVAGATTDASMLEQASTFHVKRFSPPYMLARAVSPHLAAAAEGVTIEVASISAYVARVRPEVDALVVELAGGLFSPLGAGISNADVARALDGKALLVAPDRLGVLHDVAAATRAAAAIDLRIAGVVLVAPAVADASTGTNARELGVVTDVPVVASLPRAEVAALATHPDLVALASSLLGAVVR
jgi:dethiobiotin synthetase